MTGVRKDLTGHKFGKLLALNFHERRNNKRSMWNWQCDCGNTKIIDAEKVKRGKTLSCGCWRKETSRQLCQNLTFVHGLSGTPEHTCWSNMMARCYNDQNSSFDHYGGRGIGVCDRWRYGEEGLSGFECKGKEMILTDAIKEAGVVGYATVKGRLEYGWTLEAALETPPTK